MCSFRRVAALLCGTVLCIASCSSDGAESDASDNDGTAETNTTVATTVDAAAPADIAAAVDSFVADADGGADVLVRRDGVVTRHVAGNADAMGRALTTGEPFRVGSLSKPIVSTMVLQLVEEGLVDLDEPLSTYLPAAVVGSEASVRQLLSHQSGLANYTDQPSFFADVLADRDRMFTSAEVLDYVADLPIEPTGTFSYSNTNYILLGQLIEAVDGGDLGTSLADRITGPLAMTSTYFAPTDSEQPQPIVGAWSPGVLDGKADAAYDSIASSAWSAGALVSTTDDLAAFLDALATGDALISRESFAEMTDTGTAGYGLGLFEAQLGPTQSGVAHSGGIPGYLSTMAIDPESGDLLVILTNDEQLVADQLAPSILQIW